MSGRRPTVLLAVTVAIAACWTAPATAQVAPGFEVPLLRGAADDGTQAEDEAAVDFAVDEAADELTELPVDDAGPPVEVEDPYEPLGIRLGSFLLYPAIEAFLGYSNNVFDSTTNPEGGGYYRVEPEAELLSDWSRHELRGFVSADHESFFDHSGETTTAFDAELEGRLDISARDVAGLRLAYSIIPESRGDPNVPQSVVNPPDSEVAVAEATYARRFGRFAVSVRGAAEDFTYDDALLSDGTVVDNSDRDYRELNGGIRAGIGIDDDRRSIFVEAGANRRKYRRRFDDNGVERGSQGYDVLVGMTFDRGEPLSGEVAVGYQTQNPDDPNLPDIESVAFRGSLVWQPTGLTTFTLDGSIFPEESTLDPNASGALVYSAGIGVEHSFRRNLIGSASFLYELSDYVGSPRVERDYLVVAGLEYLVNRRLSFQIDASYAKFESNIVGEDYDEARVEAGIRLQR
ncbi:outer membrane beta-barrel protein [Microbaculum marinum]|uniref:Outer membrane beta-barrel protein n=1 Tax=Microbaculum marinum TaxID=1764581 RepID=A0AAW9S206_9HYPH